MNTTAPHLTRLNTLVVIPAFNEEATVSHVLKELLSSDFQVLLVCDGCTDGTADVGRSLNVSVLELPINLGVGGALRAGFKYAVRHGFEAVVQVDADGQHPISELPNLIEAANQRSAHLIIGSRFLSLQDPIWISRIRRIATSVLAWSASSAAGCRITDSSSGFRLVRRPLLEQFAARLANNYLGDTHEALVSAGRAGYSVTEIVVEMRPRQSGVSTASNRSAFGFTIKCLCVWLLGMHKRFESVQTLTSTDRVQSG